MCRKVHADAEVRYGGSKMLAKASRIRFVAMVSLGALCLSFWSGAALANGDMHKVKHVIIVMQENHSFDNYFGALAYAPGSPYHTTSGGCRQEDHNCVDGLSCKIDAAGNLTCFNSNLDGNGTTVFAFHDSRRCVLLTE